MNVVLSDLGFVFDPITGNSFSPNPVRLDMLKMLNAGKEPDEIKACITEKYNTDDSSFNKDFKDLILVFNKYTLLEE